jgi:hypothetical protein
MRLNVKNLFKLNTDLYILKYFRVSSKYVFVSIGLIITSH